VKKEFYSNFVYLDLMSCLMGLSDVLKTSVYLFCPGQTAKNVL
jgi:hypothetical protein